MSEDLEAWRRLGGVQPRYMLSLYRGVIEAPPRCPTVASIQKVVAQHYRLTHTDLLSERRARDVARPRQVAMWLCKQLTTRSLPDIGRRFGGRDHTTVMHAVRRVEALRQEDAKIARDCAHLMDLLSGDGE